MYRKLMKDLIDWKEKKRRKPLILWGARQTGKTWLMKEFGKNEFENTVYISFYNNTRISSLFEGDYNPVRIIRMIETELHVSIDPRNTLLIFDEVQTAPHVIESLKYFCEEAPDQAVICAGSLLGVSIHEGVSFPVGKVDELWLHPMDFNEFLIALNEDNLAEYAQSYTSSELNYFSERYKELLKQYLCVGGMPEVVSVYAENRSLTEAREVQLMICSQYESDFGKHITPLELPRIRMVWNSIPLQLAKENKKFFFGQMKKGARRAEYEMAIQWLKDAGIIHIVPMVTKPANPLKAYIDMSAFKIYMIDVGILGALSELDIENVIKGDKSFTEFKGALAEQYILQEMIATGIKPYYSSSEKSTYEVDFLIQKNGEIIPVEVKAEDNLRSKSLKVFCEKYHPAKAVRFSTAGYRDQEWMMNIPHWAAAAYFTGTPNNNLPAHSLA